MSTTADYWYTVRVRYGPVPDDLLPLDDDPFYIDIRPWFTPPDQSALRSTIRKEALLPHGQLLSHETARPPLTDLLSTVGIRANDPIINSISDSARVLRLLPTCRGSQGLIVPGIELLIMFDEIEASELAMERWTEGVNRVRYVPATDTSIEALEKVVVDGGSGTMEQCTICFEELCCGTGISRMSCSHMYHGECIVRWLKTSNLCPLCRYQMPTSI